MENSDKDACINGGFQAELSTKEIDRELPLVAKTGIDETGTIIFCALYSCIDEEAFIPENELMSESDFKNDKKDTIHGMVGFETCYKTFKRKDNLTSHLLVHTDERPYKCDECRKAFKRKSHLNRHLLIHDERPYRCETCGMSFNLNAKLNIHVLIHTNEKPYSCEKCGKSFRDNSNLGRHQLTHTKGKSHVCNECHKVFTRKDNLKKHVRTHKCKKPLV